MNWESILKKEWAEDDYEHPVVKELFRLIKKIEEALPNLKEAHRSFYDAQYKALKFFETNCSKYNISLRYGTSLLVILPNDTALTCPVIADSIVTSGIEASVFLKGDECPVCIKTPEGSTLPFFDYVTTMVDVAFNRGRGMNIDAIDLAHKWIEKGITWGGGDYIDYPRLYTPLSQNNLLFQVLIENYHNDPDKLDFIADSLLPYHEAVIKVFNRLRAHFTDWVEKYEREVEE